MNGNDEYCVCGDPLCEDCGGDSVIDIRMAVNEADPDMLFCDGFDEALIGYTEQFGRPPVATYDRGKCIEILMGQGMTEEEAEEYFQFNTIGAWVGDYTPIFVTMVR